MQGGGGGGGGGEGYLVISEMSCRFIFILALSHFSGAEVKPHVMA